MAGWTDVLGAVLPALATAGVGLYGISQANKQNKQQAQAVTNASNKELELYEQARQDSLKWNALLLNVQLEQQGYEREERRAAIERYLEEQGYSRAQTERQWEAYEDQVSRQSWLDALTERAYEENRADTTGLRQFVQALEAQKQAKAEEATGVSRDISEKNYQSALQEYQNKASYLEGVMADPKSTAEWLNWAQEASKAYDASIDSLNSDLTKRGISGGIRTSGLSKLATQRAQNIGDALQEIIANATQQRANLAVPTQGEPQFYQSSGTGGLGNSQTALQALSGSLTQTPTVSGAASSIPGTSGVSAGYQGSPSIPQVTVPTSSSIDYSTLGSGLGSSLQAVLRQLFGSSSSSSSGISTSPYNALYWPTMYAPT